jgi:hypothetical protein
MDPRKQKTEEKEENSIMENFILWEKISTYNYVTNWQTY